MDNRLYLILFIFLWVLIYFIFIHKRGINKVKFINNSYAENAFMENNVPREINIALEYGNENLDNTEHLYDLVLSAKDLAENNYEKILKNTKDQDNKKNTKDNLNKIKKQDINFSKYLSLTKINKS